MSRREELEGRLNGLGLSSAAVEALSELAEVIAAEAVEERLRSFAGAVLERRSLREKGESDKGRFNDVVLSELADMLDGR